MIIEIHFFRNYGFNPFKMAGCHRNKDITFETKQNFLHHLTASDLI